MTTWIEGIDAAWSRPTPAQLTAAGKHFIVGYVSHDAGKNLTAPECVAYLDAGIAVGLVWETTSDRALDGSAAGSADGVEARRQARVLGFPDDRPIFTAVDFDATPAQLATSVRAYLTAFAAAVGGTPLAGVYGGLDTVRYALDNRLVGWGWQTYAWSHGVWDPRAYAQQYRNGVSIAGHDTDLDRAVDLTALWTKESTAMTAPTPQQNAEEAFLGIRDSTKRGYTGKPGVTAGTDLGSGADAARAALAQSQANGASLTDIKTTLATPLPISDADVARIAAAVVAALPPSSGASVGTPVEFTGTVTLGGTAA